MLDDTTDFKTLLKNPDLVCDKALVSGNWVAAQSGKTFEVRNPARGDVSPMSPTCRAPKSPQRSTPRMTRKKDGPRKPARSVPMSCANGST